MPNHFHFLIYVKEADANFLAKASTEKTRNSIRFVNHEIDQNAFLEDQAKRFFSRYALAFNKQHIAKEAPERGLFLLVAGDKRQVTGNK